MKNSKIIFFVLAMLSASCVRQDLPANNTLSPTTTQHNYTHQLKIGEKSLMVEISSTTAQMEQGLSGRAMMEDSQGMLFDFGQQPRGAEFWMKDMKFNLDFIWIAGGKIVGITPGVPHPNSSNDPLPTYTPPQPVNQVLEVNAGWAKKNNISVGDVVHLEN